MKAYIRICIVNTKLNSFFCDFLKLPIDYKQFWDIKG